MSVTQRSVEVDPLGWCPPCHDAVGRSMEDDTRRGRYLGEKMTRKPNGCEGGF